MLQFGGAAGTLAALDDRGLDIAERLAALLDLPLPEAPWHSHRDRLAEVASAFAILTGTCGKIARDVSLLMQTEVAEAFEPAAPGRGGSSTMPHKRNPTAAATALAAATIAPNMLATICAAQVQEHERALGGWQAEWPTFPALALVTSGAVAAIVDIAQGIDVDSERMGVNLSATQGRIMAEAVSFALASKLGKQEAHRIVAEASRKAAAAKRDLQEVMAEEPGDKAAHARRACQVVRTHDVSRRRANLHRPPRRFATGTRRQALNSNLMSRFRSSQTLAAPLMRTSETKGEPGKPFVQGGFGI